MSEEAFMQRTVTCGDLRATDEGKSVILNGWVHRDRNHGALHFINLRDRYGLTQVVVDDDASQELQEVAASLKLEYCIAVKGIVRRRPDSMINPDMATGEIEVKAEKIEILSQCAVLPFMIDDECNAKEDLRLKYRFLDLRSKGMTDRIVLRHKIVKAIREYFYKTDFLEIETPTLIRSTPEGARDFLVPSRIYPGKFFALPQSPQLYKQLLMVSGMDKYFQIARCYRDEDPRGDRQLEFTQLDIEMSYVTRDDVLLMMEDLFNDVFKKVLDVDLPKHFKRIAYNDALNTYGCDKPDLRFGLEMHDASSFAAKSTFNAFLEPLKGKGAVKYIVAPHKDGFDYTRKYITELEDAAKVYGAKGLAWMKVQDGKLSGGVTKYFAGLESEVLETTGAKDGDLILLVAHDNWKKCCNSLGAVRSKLGADLKLINEDEFAFCWIIDFPLFEYNEDEGHWEAAHHMFSMPQAEYIDTLESDPGAVKGDLYDLVLNGYELASGSIRIHDIELQKRIFRICNFPDDVAQERFGFLLDAFKFSPPPHGGIAPGIDRLCMIISKVNTIREVIAFPKNTAAMSPMDDCPAYVEEGQLNDLKLKIVQEEK
ncbi:MAG: aspartate--tRNA ligase [Spirochaetales bacterium]|uniref:aspartate--tRNA ligase n=1 Tax=Bullifex sp. TaxID=2815808 RepID=UPI002A58B494|nr:aspartate--tRNA ligase [Bullifex sp.]MDD5973630.1 aspartate--tRNA ligase [Spirochaetales bacterium]MDD7271816.1 aspartate--tRNA ligase [Spirochaetales bacterium]MDY4068142.1 aspartate--tRNA ligase [Bullifex sp.]